MADKKKADLKSDRPGFMFWFFIVLFVSLFVAKKQYIPTPPICPGSQFRELHVGDSFRIPLRMECTTNWMRPQQGSRIFLENGRTKGEFHLLFANGEKFHFYPESYPVIAKFPNEDFIIWGRGTPLLTVRSKH